MTRKCFFPQQRGESSGCRGEEVAAGHRPQDAAITLSALEGLDGEPVSPTAGPQGGASIAGTAPRQKRTPGGKP